MSDSTPTTRRIGRRGYLLAGATAVTALTAGCSGGGGGGDGDGGDGGDGSDGGADVGEEAQSEVDDYLSNTSNYDGTIVDRTDVSEPTVDVGAPGNNGNYAYEPAAIAVSPGTTVTWEWTGKGQQHNVVEESGGYESQLVADQGFTFSHTFEGTGVSLYFCTPHQGFGMNGAVVVQE